ncbi:MAG: sugar phosphate isomerase/epimerase [Clostridia bacterium]|nr:sugar phosphate isomerase/epimerase [Clostridia bacterium]
MTNRKDWPLALSVGPAAMNGETFDALAEAGIRELELSSGAIDPFYAVLDFPHKAKAIAAEAKAHGVTISSVHLPFVPFGRIDPASPDPAVKKDILAVQTELMNAAGDAGIGKAIIHPSGEPYREEERTERINCAVDVIGTLTERATAAGVTLCLENLPRTCLCRTSDEMLVFLSAIPDLCVVFDTNHSLTEDNVHYIRTVGEKIVSLHVSDYDFIDEKHWLPLEGKNDWAGIVKTLEEVGYAGRFLYELKAGYTYTQIAENYRTLLA